MLWRMGRKKVNSRQRGRCLIGSPNESERMNGIIYIVGLIVIVLFVLGFFGLR